MSIKHQIYFNLLLSSINFFGLLSLWCFAGQPTIGVIDPASLIAREAALIAKNYPNGAPANKIPEIAFELQRAAANYAAAHNILLLGKNALWGGLALDHTEHVLAMVQREK